MPKQWKSYLKARVFSEDFVEIMICANLAMVVVSGVAVFGGLLFGMDVPSIELWPLAHICAMGIFIGVKVILKTKKAILRDYAEWEYKQDRKKPDSNKNI